MVDDNISSQLNGCNSSDEAARVQIRFHFRMLRLSRVRERAAERAERSLIARLVAVRSLPLFHKVDRLPAFAPRLQDASQTRMKSRITRGLLTSEVV